MGVQGLIDRDDSVLVVIDVQKAFVGKLDAGEKKDLLARIRFMVLAAKHFGIPLVVTCEDIPNLGLTVPAVRDVLPDGQIEHNKMIFGLCDNPEIMTAVEATGRKTAVLVGLETDVCVLHSALGLQERGYRVVAVEDAVGSPHPAHEMGLHRMRAAGVTMTICKTMAWEWARGVANSMAFHKTFDGTGEIPSGVVL